MVISVLSQPRSGRFGDYLNEANAREFKRSNNSRGLRAAGLLRDCDGHQQGKMGHMSNDVSLASTKNSGTRGF
jgi:hypothetical protein